MRIFCFIFSFYLLLLSVQPCADFAAEFPCASTGAEQSQRQDIGTQNESENRECSPFCICSCRQTPTADATIILPIQQEAAVSTKSIVEVCRRSEYSHQPSNMIWQPPKFNFTV